MKNKKAFTLVELCIVIALVAIVGTMVTSFCVMVSGNAAKADAVNNLQDDIQKAKDVMARWISVSDEEGAEFVVSEDGTELQVGSVKLDLEAFGFTDTTRVEFSVESNQEGYLIIGTFYNETASDGKFVVYRATRAAMGEAA